jgi:hypothetical protein
VKPHPPPAMKRITAQQSAIVGANIRALRQARGWPQHRVGELMGLAHPRHRLRRRSHRDGRQRSFLPDEIRRKVTLTKHTLTMDLFGIQPYLQKRRF